MDHPLKFIPEVGDMVRVIGVVHHREHRPGGVSYRPTTKYARRVFEVVDFWGAQDDFQAIRLWAAGPNGKEGEAIDILIKHAEFQEIGAYNSLELIQPKRS